jgi:5'-3' exonuclease
MELTLNNNKNIVLIDTSYYTFYRYFATIRWFTFQKIEFDIDDIINNEVFIKAFIKHIDADIKKIIKKWDSSIDNIIFCMDCSRCDIWRNDIYKEYKGTRVQSNNFNRNIFPVLYDYIVKLGIKQINIDRLEADDVIYLTQKCLKEKLKNNDIVVITNDNDYLQIVGDKIILINMQFKELKARGVNDPRQDLLIKAMYGDKSDNILKIASFISKEKAHTIALMGEEERIAYLKENDCYDKFCFNMTLISFDFIPDKYIKEFERTFNFIMV